ncbi:MAG: DUF5668 domain-containing protein [Thermoanaerobaculia bacterium]
MRRTGSMRRGTAGRLIWGLFLVALGALLFAANLGYDIPHGVWNYWPFLLIATGVARLVFADDGDGRSGGLWILLAGLYGWMSIWHIWGLNWGTAWPIFVIASGVSILLRPVFGSGRRRAELETVSTGSDHAG